MPNCGDYWPSLEYWWCDYCRDYHRCGDFPWLDPACCSEEPEEDLTPVNEEET